MPVLSVNKQVIAGQLPAELFDERIQSLIGGQAKYLLIPGPVLLSMITEELRVQLTSFIASKHWEMKLELSHGLRIRGLRLGGVPTITWLLERY